jgi:heme-degrading monooxygenase HmoA
MIMRLWSGRTADDHAADAYEDVFGTHVLGELSALAGFRGAYLLRRPHGPGAELLTLTMFDTLDDVRRFAGADLDAAQVSPAARAVLADVDERVRHFSVAGAPPNR